jgi:hypothetical protein
MSMWCVMAAPLIAGNDLRSMSATTKAMLTNKEVIRVDQDSLGAQGRKVAGTSTNEVLVKKMKDGGYAVLFVNRGNSATTISATWQQIGSADPQGVGLAAATPLWGRDLWGHQNLGRLTTSYSKSVPARDVFFMRLYTYDYTVATGAVSPTASLGLVPGFMLRQETNGLLIRTGSARSATVSIADVTGRIMLTGESTAAGESHIPLTALSAGMYVATVKSGTTTEARRLLVK